MTHNSNRKSGQLKIFLGYAAGVGKTYAMLKEAKEQLQQGTDVVIGYIEPHPRKETNALIEGFEVVPTKVFSYKGKSFRELDLDGIIQRAPDLVLIDELAHTNIPNLRHAKRYGDIQELLNQGINVYTTLNIQHIESLHDLVEEITQIKVRERIPDAIVDQASQIKLVDIEPEELIKRLKEGKIYKQPYVEKALNHFFQQDNLIALREIALRRIADTVHLKTKCTQLNTVQNNVLEHILVGISSSPTNAKVIRTAARLAQALHGKFTALYVDRGNSLTLSKADEERLKDHMKLAQQLEGNVVTVQEDSIATAIANYAQISGVTKLVIGKTMTKSNFFGKTKITDKINELLPDLSIYIVPDQENTPKKKIDVKTDFKLQPLDFLKMIFVFVIVALVGLFFKSLGISEVNIITIFILGVLIVAIWTTGWLMNIISSLVAVLSFNFLFTKPIFSFEVYHQDYPMTFTIMFVSGVITSSLMKKVKMQGRQAIQKSYRMETLLETNRKLQSASTYERLIEEGAMEIVKITERPVCFYLVDDKQMLHHTFYKSPFLSTTQNCEQEHRFSDKNEVAIVYWVINNERTAGMTTDVFKEAHGYYVPFLSNNKVIGVMGISLHKKEQLPSFEWQVLHAILNDFSLALDKWQLLRINEDVRREKELEQIQSNLLRSISHDLRTPLTSISGHADILKTNDQKMSGNQRQTLYEDIYYNANRLVQLVENLLAVSKLSNGHFPLQMQEELLEDVIHEAIHQLSKNSTRPIQAYIEPEFLLAHMDTRLIGQVLINLLDNAVSYTPVESIVAVYAFERESNVIIEVRDTGKGIPDEQKIELFQTFKKSHMGQGDTKRGLGIGLSLCQTILKLHESELTVRDNIPHGTIFSFYLKRGGVVNES